MIELIDVHKSFSEHIALQDINLLIQENEIFGIIGRSGAGKSTLLRSINLLERPDRGEVVIDHQPISKLSTPLLRRARHKTAMIFQHFNLLNSKNVYDNIALPMRIQGFEESLIREKIHELLPLVELEDKVHAHPNTLSGGQKQRVAIARALSCSPKILLCDEATSALDPETTESILNLLKKINRLYGITIVIITHEMDVVKHICHRLAVMEHGKILEVYSLAEAFHQPQSIARKMLYARLSPKLPDYLTDQLHPTPNDRPMLRILFEGEGANRPFISQISRELGVDITILLANIDNYDDVTCGVLIVALHAQPDILQRFLQRCQEAHLNVEVLGYVTPAMA